LKLIQQIRQWASIGHKDYAEHSISLFKNDLILPDATILYKMGNKRTTILPCNTMDVLTTSDDNFCKKTEEYLNNVISKSNLISTSGEKDRNKFFNQIEERILQTKSRLQ
jgi:hypothetical protein